MYGNCIFEYPIKVTVSLHLFCCSTLPTDLFIKMLILSIKEQIYYGKISKETKNKWIEYLEIVCKCENKNQNTTTIKPRHFYSKKFSIIRSSSSSSINNIQGVAR